MAKGYLDTSTDPLPHVLLTFTFKLFKILFKRLRFSTSPGGCFFLCRFASEWCKNIFLLQFICIYSEREIDGGGVCGNVTKHRERGGREIVRKRERAIESETERGGRAETERGGKERDREKEGGRR